MKQKRKPLIDTFVERNSKLNLSAIRDVDSIYTKHILDSIELNKKITLTPGSTLADVGTG
jgi:16S rRNA (guanine527-N7)-methyltransferase